MCVRVCFVYVVCVNELVKVTCNVEVIESLPRFCLLLTSSSSSATLAGPLDEPWMFHSSEASETWLPSSPQKLCTKETFDDGGSEEEALKADIRRPCFGF